MLVITRRSKNPNAANRTNKDQSRVSLYLGDVPMGTITVVMAANGTARLGFAFDPEVRIIRSELLEKPKEEPTDV